MSEIRGPKALELWCRRITDGYPSVNVQNMTTSWRDGLAFCAMIHHFRPDLIDFASLNKDDVYGNNELAFRIAAQHLGIPALLDAEDMASCAVPDRLSILTYLSQFYQHFGGSSPSRVAVNRTQENKSQGITPVAESPPSKVAQRLGMRRDQCAVCEMPVFLAEKLVIGRTIYHRVCFKCARCHNQLTPGNYYETENGEYCCETCPDEESTDTTDTHIDSFELNEKPVNIDHIELSNYHRALSDEEKYVQQKHYNIDNVVESKSMSEISQMRLNFMSSHLLVDETNIDNSSDQLNEYKVSPDNNCTKVEAVSDIKSMTSLNENDSCSNKFVYNIDDSTDNSIHNRCLTATNRNIDCKREFKRSQDTKETLGVVDSNGDDDDVKDETLETNKNIDQCLPLVKRRLEMFENLVTNVSNNKNIKLTSKTSKYIEPDSLEVINNGVENDDKLQIASLQKDDVKLIEDTTTKEKNHHTEIDLKVEKIDDYPSTMNPFSDEEDERDEESVTLNSSIKKVSTNPFGSDDSEEDNDEVITNLEMITPKPAARINRNDSNNTQLNGAEVEQLPKRRLVAPQINLNPFWSDDEDFKESNTDDECVNKMTLTATPIPKPRTTKSTLETISHLTLGLQKDGIYASNSSIGSSSSTATSGSHYRKRKSAPPPPLPPLPPHQPLTIKEKSTSIFTSHVMNPASNTEDSPTRMTPKLRKNKRAPPPPPPPPPPLASASNNTPEKLLSMSNLYLNESSVINQPVISIDDDKQKDEWEDSKINKNVSNKSKQSVSVISLEEDEDYSFKDKSVQGKWKRKKAPAPARPTPQRRKIKVMSVKDVNIELSEIEMQQQGLEKQGVRLEELIREKCESGTQDEESSLSMDADELVLELFALVNEKNELFRRQAELILLKRQQRLEEEHADIEYQIRCLMCQPEATKTDFDKQREETLIQRLVDIVERRSEIVECLEMDRRREVEEDKSINMHMEIYTAKNKSGEYQSSGEPSIQSVKSIKTKVKTKLKEKQHKKDNVKDADKDVDETEVKLKRQNKRKWF